MRLSWIFGTLLFGLSALHLGVYAETAPEPPTPAPHNSKKAKAVIPRSTPENPNAPTSVEGTYLVPADKNGQAKLQLRADGVFGLTAADGTLHEGIYRYIKGWLSLDSGFHRREFMVDTDPAGIKVTRLKSDKTKSGDPIGTLKPLQSEPEIWQMQDGKKPVEVAKVEAPKVEAPKVEVAKVEAPKVEAPKVEVTKVEAPKVEAPKVEVAKVEAPKVEAPKVEVAKVEAPKVEAPKVEVAKVEAPKVEAPKVEVTKVEAPKVEAPKVEVAKVEAPKVEAPKVEASEVSTLRDKNIAARESWGKTPGTYSGKLPNEEASTAKPALTEPAQVIAKATETPKIETPAGPEPITGRFRFTANPLVVETLVLRKDGAFIYKDSNGVAVAGYYQWKGTSLQLTAGGMIRLLQAAPTATGGLVLTKMESAEQAKSGDLAYMSPCTRPSAQYEKIANE